MEKPSLFDQIKVLHQRLDNGFIASYKRSLPFGDTICNRWDRAKKLGFGERTSIYDSSIVFLPVKMGRDCWIGPNTIIDGTGGLTIGDSCTLSAGVQIYTHDNVKQTLMGRDSATEIERLPVKIGNNVYLAPNVVVAKGVEIGSHCIVAVNSFVNKSVPDKSIMAGNPAIKIGIVEIDGNQVTLIYDTCST